jgi:FLVCR family MFS transporter 7
VVIIACILNGFFSYALFPVYLELAAEGKKNIVPVLLYVSSFLIISFSAFYVVTYPVSESISSCIIWSLCTATMLIFSIIIDALRAGPDANPPNNMNTSMIVVACIVFVGNIPCLWIKGDLKRLQIDSKKNDEKA